MTTPPRFEHWALVEIFGHTRLAGRVSEATIGGCQFVRIDIPETQQQAAFTRLYGQGAIYSITLVSEDVARLAAEQLQEQPLTVYMPQVRLLKDRVEVTQEANTWPVDEDDRDEDDRDEDEEN